MRIFWATAICATGLVSTPALALHCYELALKDSAGVVIPLSVPPVGLMVGGNPVIEGSYPPHVKREPIAPAQCPATLVESVRQSFNASCPGEDLRKKAAAANKISRELVDQGCNDMATALLNKDVEFYQKRDKELFPNHDGIFPTKPGEK